MIPYSTQLSPWTEMSGTIEVVASPFPIDVVVEAIKRHSEIEFVLDGVAYYGVEQELIVGSWAAVQNMSVRRQALHFSGILKEVAKACDETLTTQLRAAVAQFEAVLNGSGGRTCRDRSRVFARHGLRIIARLLVAYQDYYLHHPSQLSTLFMSRFSGGRGAAPPPAIVKVYATGYDINNPVATLETQFLGLSAAWCELVQELSGQELLQVERSTGEPRSLRGTVLSKSTCASAELDVTEGEQSLTNPSECSSSHQSRSVENRPTLMVTPSGVYDLADRQNLRTLAKTCLVHDWSAEPPADFSGNLTSISRNLPDHQQKYLHEQLLPYLTRKRILKVVILAAILGFAEVVRCIPKHKEIKKPSPLLIRRFRGIGFSLLKSKGGC
jgi:hypothetical protein